MRKTKRRTTNSGDVAKRTRVASYRPKAEVLPPPLPPRVPLPSYGMRREHRQRHRTNDQIRTLSKPQEKIHARSQFDRHITPAPLHRTRRPVNNNVHHAGNIYSPCSRKKLVRRAAIIASGKGGTNHTRQYQKQRRCR